MYDIIILETSVFVRPHVNDKLAVFLSPLWGPLSGHLCFWCPKRPFSCGRRAKNTLIRVDGASNSCKQMWRLYGYDVNESTPYEQNNSSARTSRLLLLCFVVHCTTTTWNFLIRRFVEDLERTATNYCYWIRMLFLEFKSRKICLHMLSWTTLHKRKKVNLKRRQIHFFNNVFNSEA